MPYSGPDDTSIPSNVKDLPYSDREEWVDTWNGVYDSCIAGGGDTDECEGKAFAAANAKLTKENNMDGPDRVFLKKIRDLVDYFLGKTGRESADNDRAVAVGDVWENIWDSLIDDDLGIMNGWPLDIFVENNQLFAVIAREGKLYRVDLDIQEDGTVTMFNEMQVMHQFVPVEGERTAINTFRQKDGRLRVVAVVCTAVLNRVGEIDSTQLFDSFVNHAVETDEYPIVNFFHQGERSRLGQADYVARDGYLYVASYVFDDNEFGRAASRGFENNAEYFGHSIEFESYNVERMEVVDGIKLPIHTEGINTAITILGENSAAALFTATKSMQGVQRMDQKIKSDLIKLLDGDEELADKFEELVDGTNRSIEEENMIARSVEDTSTEDNSLEEEEIEVDTEAETEEVLMEEEVDTEIEAEEAEEELEEVEEELEEVEEEQREFVIDETVIQAISEQLADQNEDRLTAINSAISELQELVHKLDRSMSGSFTLAEQQIEALGERVSQIEKPQEEQARDLVARMPQQAPDRVIFRPSERRAIKNSEVVEDMQDKAESTLDSWKGHK